jgi:type IV fimbrial biogenesis protein FimT
VPSFQDTALNSKLDAISSRFVANANLARSEAIKRNTTVTLCAPSTLTSSTCAGTGAGDWGTGWIVLTGTQVVARENAPPQGFVLHGTQSIIFQPSVVGTTVATMTICRSSPSIGAYKRNINISITGQVSVEKASATTCP